LKLGPRTKRALRFASLLVGSLLAAALLFEGLLRFLLFSDASLAQRAGARFRRAELYSSERSGRDYWKLDALFARNRPPDPRTPPFDARFGWLKPEIDPATLRHADEAALGARRPVLLYGDSYAACMLESGDCWQQLLEHSELGAQYALLNYGVVGYGLDQTYLLLRATHALYAERQPIVVIGILVDDDLDRCYLHLRDLPRPYFTLAGTGLELHAPEGATRSESVERDPPAITSYAWRLFLTQSGLVKPWNVPAWIGEGEHVEVKQELATHLLTAIEDELAGVPHFYFLFHSKKSAATPRPFLWQEPLLYDEFQRRGLPFVSAKRALIDDLLATKTPLSEYFNKQGWGLNHYDARGNAVVFTALRAGLEGQFEPYEYLRGVKGASATIPRKIRDAFEAHEGEDGQ